MSAERIAQSILDTEAEAEAAGWPDEHRQDPRLVVLAQAYLNLVDQVESVKPV